MSGACGPADGPRAADDHPAPADGAQPLTGRRISSSWTRSTADRINRFQVFSAKGICSQGLLNV